MKHNAYHLPRSKIISDHEKKIIIHIKNIDYAVVE